MKKLILIIFITISHFANAQNKFCKDIVKNTQNSSVIYTSPTPSVFLGAYYMQFSLNKVIYTDGSIIALQIGFDSKHEDSPTDVSITFTDKDQLSYSNVPYKHEYAKTSSATTDSYIPTVILNSSDIEKLKTKKVDFYSVGGVKCSNMALTNYGNKILAYANCLSSLTAAPSEIDPCNSLTKTFDDMKNVTTYCSPLNELIRVSKTITASNSSSEIVFCLYKNTFDDTPQTVYVKFDDGTVVNFPSQSSCVKSSGSFFYACVVSLQSDNINTFKAKKIVKYQIANTDYAVDNTLSSNTKGWVNCLDNLK